MANLTIRFGVILVLLGVITYFAVASHAPTSLIPAYFGLVLIGLGALARTEDAKKRMLWMHIAVTVGLVGAIIPLVRATGKAIQMVQGVVVEHRMAVIEQMLMALICIIFVALCVRSFVAARRARI
ncbi:MAG: hypothetical protein JSS87_14460 [Acidobacteria bacterium]|nr:hypothetical protein [Acidobacteriota bacterium]